MISHKYVYKTIKFEFWFTDIKEAQSFVEQHTEQIVAACNQGKDNLIDGQNQLKATRTQDLDQGKEKSPQKWWLGIVRDHGFYNLDFSLYKDPCIVISHLLHCSFQEYFLNMYLIYFCVKRRLDPNFRSGVRIFNNKGIRILQ